MQRIIEIYKNERYQPTSGFTSNGLLMNDRSKFSSIDGKSSWNTIDEAADAMISFGWEYLNSNEMCQIGKLIAIQKIVMKMVGLIVLHLVILILVLVVLKE